MRGGVDYGAVAFCRFGGSKLQRTAVLKVSSDLILCATPSVDSAGDVHLLLSNDDVVYIDTGLDFTFYVQPSVFSSALPEGGPKRGGTFVTLIGSGFDSFNPQSQPLTEADKREASR